MAEITSAMVAKYLRKLNEEHDALLQKEKNPILIPFRCSGLRINLKKKSVHGQKKYGYNLSTLLYMTPDILLYGWTRK